MRQHNARLRIAARTQNHKFGCEAAQIGSGLPASSWPKQETSLTRLLHPNTSTQVAILRFLASVKSTEAANVILHF
jgi:hypothetical protein